MAAWHTLHLEPSSLRTPDRTGETRSVDEHGRHIAATLRRLGEREGDGAAVCAEAANRLSLLVPAVRAVRVREDPGLQQEIVEVKMDADGPWLPPRALSDGTLR